MARKSTMISVGQGRATNTIKLRNEYNQYVIEQQTQGQGFLPFDEWAKQFHPDKKILKQ